MKKVFKPLIYMALGAFLWIVLSLAFQLIHIIKIMNDPVSLREPSIQTPDGMFMDSEEKKIWYSIRKKMKEGDYSSVNDLIRLNQEQLSLSINLPKEKIGENEAVLVELRITNTSNQRIIFCEPQLYFEDLQIYKRGDRYFGNFVLRCSAREARWFKIVQPSTSLSLPFIFESDYIGPHEIETTILFTKLSEDLSSNTPEVSEFNLTVTNFFEITKAQ